MIKNVGLPLLSILLATTTQGVGAEKPPLSLDPQHTTAEVEVNRLQLLVTVLPKNRDLESCSTLEHSDFSVKVMGKDRPFELDWRGSRVTELIAPAEPRQLVFVFDDRHMDGCPCDLEIAPSRSKAYAMAREALDLLPPETQLWFVTYANRLYTSPSTFFTLSDGTRAHTLLDEMEVDAGIVVEPHEHPHLLGWYELYQELLAALASRPGEKEVWHFAADIPVRRAAGLKADSNENRLTEFSAAAHAARVRISPVDTISEKRSMPYGLPVMAEYGGGRLYTNAEDLTRAVEDLRTADVCTFLVTADLRGIQRKNLLRINVRLHKPGFRVEAPKTIAGEDFFSDDQKLAAMLVLPPSDKGLGVGADLGLLALSESGWQSDLVLNLVVTDATLLPEELSAGLWLDAAVWLDEGKKRQVLFNVSNQLLHDPRLIEELTSGERRAVRKITLSRPIPDNALLNFAVLVRGANSDLRAFDRGSKTARANLPAAGGVRAGFASPAENVPGPR